MLAQGGGMRPRSPHIYVLPTFRRWLRTHLAPHRGGFTIPLTAELSDRPRQRSAVARRVGREGKPRAELTGGGGGGG